MDRDTTLKLAPIFRGLSMLLIVLTFCSWALPYFSYDADTFGIDNSKGPLRFVPQEVPAYAEVSAATYTDYVTQNLLNKDTGAYRVTLRFTPTEEFGVYDADSAMSYSDYLTQNVYDKDTGEFKVSLKIAAADVPNGASDDGTAYVSYINQYVIPAVASNSDSKFLNFFAEDIPAYDSASGSEQDYINQNLYDPATGEFRIPLRFIPKDIPLFQAEIGMTYQEYAYQYIID
ncbi:MAG: hypothetical protein LBN43_04165, partial [Oscillospiraceae bacterium]|nr:hypothetical protein [Oscillospiraceae bacterium]